MWSIMKLSCGSSAGGESAAHQQRVAAGLPGRGIAARNHVCNTVVEPFVPRQMLDHNRARPQRWRRLFEEAGQHAVLKTLDIDLQRIDVADAGVAQNTLQSQRRHLDRLARKFAADDMAGA